MRTHWNAINDFKMGKYLHKRLYESYPQRPVRFVDFLANPSDQTFFFKESSLYIYYLLLVISLFLKVYMALWTSGLGSYFVCKRFTVQTLLWSLEFVNQINLEHGTIVYFSTSITNMLFYPPYLMLLPLCLGCEFVIQINLEHDTIAD